MTTTTARPAHAATEAPSSRRGPTPTADAGAGTTSAVGARPGTTREVRSVRLDDPLVRPLLDLSLIHI